MQSIPILLRKTSVRTADMKFSTQKDQWKKKKGDDRPTQTFMVIDFHFILILTQQKIFSLISK